MSNLLFGLLVAALFALGVVRLYRLTYSEDELWEEMHGRDPRRR